MFPPQNVKAFQKRKNPAHPSKNFFNKKLALLLLLLLFLW